MDKPAASQGHIAILIGTLCCQSGAFAGMLGLGIALGCLALDPDVHVHNAEVPLGAIRLALELAGDRVANPAISVWSAGDVL